MSGKMFLMWNSELLIDGGGNINVGTFLLKANCLLVLKESSHINSNFNLGIHEQGLGIHGQGLLIFLVQKRYSSSPRLKMSVRQWANLTQEVPDQKTFMKARMDNSLGYAKNWQ